MFFLNSIAAALPPSPLSVSQQSVAFDLFTIAAHPGFSAFRSGEGSGHRRRVRCCHTGPDAREAPRRELLCTHITRLEAHTRDTRWAWPRRDGGCLVVLHLRAASALAACLDSACSPAARHDPRGRRRAAAVGARGMGAVAAVSGISLGADRNGAAAVAASDGNGPLHPRPRQRAHRAAGGSSAARTCDARARDRARVGLTARLRAHVVFHGVVEPLRIA